MNRGRRRGGVSSGFANLRDGVKRRLFDPFAVPVSPDPRTVVNRLTPLTFALPTIPSSLPQVEGNNPPPRKDELCAEEVFQLQLFESKAVVDCIFENSPARQSLPTKAEGISVGKAVKAANVPVIKSQTSTAHLLMKADEVAFWRDGTLLSSFSNPLDWYPSELADRLRAKSTDKASAAKRVKFGDNYEDPEDAGLLSEQALLDIGDANDDNDDTAVGRAEETAGHGNDGEEADEDARWNGDQVGGGDDDENEDDDGNDYCETYFDNGEGDIDDFNVQMHDAGADGDDDGGGGGGYYD